LLALVYDGLEEATEHLHAIAGTNAREARVVRQWLIQIISQVPTDAEPIVRMTHQETLRTDALKEHHELQLEEDHRINGRATTTCIGLLHELTHKREVEGSLQVPIEVIRRNQVLKGHIDKRGKASLFLAHHARHLSSS